jgi:hypothetical protein
MFRLKIFYQTLLTIKDGPRLSNKDLLIRPSRLFTTALTPAAPTVLG